MRFLFVASLLSVVGAAATFACSAGDPVAAPADAGKDARPVETPTDDDDDNGDDDDNVDPPDNDDAGTGDAAPEAGPTTGGDAGSQCRTGSTPEVEPNNTVAAATKLVPNGQGEISLCGQVATGDTDVFTFTHPFNGAFRINPSGANVTYRTKIGDQEFNGFPNGATVSADDVWVITVTSNSEAGRSYAVRIVPD